MAETQVTQRKQGAAQTTQPARTEVIYVPDVDIRENNDRILLLADMPGVEQDSVQVSVENNVLTLEGQPKVETPAGCELVGREYGAGRYRRDFTLSEVVDTAGIKAKVRHGVLEVVLPRKEETKTRKIQIET